VQCWTKISIIICEIVYRSLKSCFQRYEEILTKTTTGLPAECERIRFSCSCLKYEKNTLRHLPHNRFHEPVLLSAYVQHILYAETIFYIHGGPLIRAERQSARMSKITNDGLTRSGTRCFNSGTHIATVGVKGLNDILHTLCRCSVSALRHIAEENHHCSYFTNIFSLLSRF